MSIGFCSSAGSSESKKVPVIVDGCCIGCIGCIVQLFICSFNVPMASVMTAGLLTTFLTVLAVLVMNFFASHIIHI
ncbi:MAG: hypothetical protein J6S85_23605 [Methanobrevibacter sp.]|nr:hypothetical protein [Methanobrevibacter sp.]